MLLRVMASSRGSAAVCSHLGNGRSEFTRFQFHAGSGPNNEATPRVGATLAFLRKTLKRDGRITSLDLALARTKADDAASEFESIVRELYRKTSQFRVGIKLLDRSALDWPELAALWSGHWRAGLVNQLSRYLDLRISQQLLSPVPDTKAWGRFIVERWHFSRCTATTIRFRLL
jgi:hypothetical protein